MEPLPHRLRVLIVGDYPDMAESLAVLIGLWGFVAETCRDGDTVADRCRRFRPHVVLLDLGLPKVDGLTLARQLRGHDVTLVAVTGYADEHFRQECRDADFAHFLVKPVDPRVLKA